LGSIKFETALSRLETLVNHLEKGDLPLEQSLKLFEEGVRLSQSCTRLLNEAEKKVEMLLHDKEGAPQHQPYPSDEMKEDITSDDLLSPSSHSDEEGTE